MLRLRPALIGLLSVLCVSSALAQETAAMTVAQARDKIIKLNKMWGKARLDFDKAVYEKSLAADFYVEIDGKKQTRKEFIDEISQVPAGVKFLRFDVDVLTVMKNGDHWDAVIGEKLEGEGKGRDGKTHHFYSYWVTRDGWKEQEDKNWQALYSIALGHQDWLDQKPPVIGW